jgi:hypothetical protein
VSVGLRRQRNFFKALLFLLALLMSGCSALKVNETLVKTVPSGDGVANLHLIRFTAPEVIEVVDALRREHGWIGVRLLSVETSRRSFAVDRILKPVNQELQIIEALMLLGVDANDVRVEIYDDQITVEKLNPY